MPLKYQIKQTVQFREYTTIPKEQSENVLFYIINRLIIPL